MRIRVIDFETTGQPPEADVVESAYQDVVVPPVMSVIDFTQDGWAEPYLAGIGTTLVKNQRPIEIEAMAAHHIPQAEIDARGIDWDEARERLVDGGVDFYCAHNANFEKEFFDFEGARWLDTLKMAYRVMDDAPSFSNQGLRYFLQGADPGEAGMPPHRALPDCAVTARILLHCLVRAPIKVLEEWSAEPAMPPTIRFGKHRGKKWCDLPADYLQWMLRSDFDDDTKHCARVHLRAKSGGRC